MRRIIALCCMLFLAPWGECFANSVALEWDPVETNNDGTPCTDLAGYRLSMGTSTGMYIKTFDVGMGQETLDPCITSPTPGCVRRAFTVSGLPPDTYYFVATAYNTSGSESAPSNEISTALSSDTTLPGDVLSFTATPYSSGARLSWINPPDQDLAQVVLEWRFSNSGFMHLATLTAMPGMAQTYDHLGLTPETYVYAIHTRDTSGNTTHTAYTETAIGNAAQPATNASGGGGGGGCFIATAAYGSYLDPHVVVLRKFRDDHLLTNRPGRAFVAVYYYTAPTIADFISRHEWARKGVQVALAPVVLTVRSPALGALFMLLCLGILAFVITSCKE